MCKGRYWEVVLVGIYLLVLWLCFFGGFCWYKGVFGDCFSVVVGVGCLLLLVLVV